MRGRKAKTAPQARKVVGYVRVSTDDQTREGISLEAQRARIKAYCAAMSLELAEIVEDAGVSAKSLSRPGMQRIRRGMKSGEIGAVVAIKLDRFTRNLGDFVDLLKDFAKADSALISVSESLDTKSASGRLVTHMFGVIAQWERETIGERTRDALAHKRKQGGVYARVPFGYLRDGDQLVKDDGQQAALAMAREMHCAGASLRGIAKKLTELGVAPKCGGREWHPSSVRSVLLSKMTTASA